MTAPSSRDELGTIREKCRTSTTIIITIVRRRRRRKIRNLIKCQCVYHCNCPRAKTRGGALEASAYIGNVVYSPGKNLDFRELGPQKINEMLAKDYDTLAKN